jgi:chromosome segregation ATPase
MFSTTSGESSKNAARRNTRPGSTKQNPFYITTSNGKIERRSRATSPSAISVQAATMMTALMAKQEEFQKSCELLAVDVDDELQKFQQKHQEIDAQIEALKDKNNKNEDIRDEINDLTTKLNNAYYELRMAELTKNQNLEQITNQVSFLTNSVNSMNWEHFPGIRTELTDILDQQQYVLSELKRVEDRANNVSSQVQLLETTVTTLRRKMGELDDLKRATNTNIMTLQARAASLEHRVVDLQTFHEVHRQDIINIPDTNRSIATLTAQLNNESTARQQLSERVDLIESRRCGR